MKKVFGMVPKVPFHFPILFVLFYLLTSQLQAWPIIWDNGGNEQCFGAATDASANVIAVGYHQPYNNEWRVAKYNSAGTFLWEQTWDYGWGSQALDVATDGSSNIYVCGSYPNPYDHDWKIIKYSSGGSVLWERNFGGGYGDDVAYGIATDPSGNVIVTGYYHSQYGNNIWRVVKYNSSGTFLWEQTWDYGWGSQALDVATDGSGNIYVCGSYPNPYNHDWKIIVYRANGTIAQEYSGWDLGGDDVPYDIAVRGSYFYAAGVTNGYGTYDWVIQRYNIVAIEEQNSQNNIDQIRLCSFPNPVRFCATISYHIPSETHVQLAIFNVNGQLVQELMNEHQESGYHRVNWDIHNVSGKQLPNGVYFYRLTTGDFSETRKLIILR